MTFHINYHKSITQIHLTQRLDTTFLRPCIIFTYLFTVDGSMARLSTTKMTCETYKLLPGKWSNDNGDGEKKRMGGEGRRRRRRRETMLQIFIYYSSVVLGGMDYTNDWTSSVRPHWVPLRQCAAVPYTSKTWNWWMWSRQGVVAGPGRSRRWLYNHMQLSERWGGRSPIL